MKYLRSTLCLFGLAHLVCGACGAGSEPFTNCGDGNLGDDCIQILVGDPLRDGSRCREGLMCESLLEDVSTTTCDSGVCAPVAGRFCSDWSPCSDGDDDGFECVRNRCVDRRTRLNTSP